jgi:hypothetical protein
MPLLVAVLVASVVTSSAFATTTREEYAGQVNQICKQGGRQAKKSIAKLRPTGNPALDQYREGVRFNKVFGRTVRRIAAVDPAPGDEVTVARLVDGLRRQKRLTDKILRAFKRQKLGRVGVLSRKLQRVRRVGEQDARALGLTGCLKASNAG